MLNRRILRVKVFKTIYAYAENPQMNLAQAQAHLDALCQGTRDLYLFMLAFVPALTQHAAQRIEQARNKFYPSEEERNPNLKFAENALAPIIAQDPDFNKIIAKKKLSWEPFDSFLWNYYEELKGYDFFRSYMSRQERSAKEDAQLFCDIFASLQDNPKLEEILQELSIWWDNDLAYSLNCCCTAVEQLAAGKLWSLPELYLSQMPGQNRKESDKDFVYGLLRRAFCDFNKDINAIAEVTEKWDINRVCVTDLALIVCGMAESAAFPDMPVRVIINEYVEISKYFSTHESKGFVNGVLDKLLNKQ